MGHARVISATSMHRRLWGRNTSSAATVLSSFWSFSTRIASSDRAPGSTGLSTRCTLSPFGVPSCCNTTPFAFRSAKPRSIQRKFMLACAER